MSLLSNPYACSRESRAPASALHLGLVLVDAQSRNLRDRVAHWAQRQLNQHHDLVIDIIDSSRWAPSSAPQPALEARLKEADAFLMVLSPEETHVGSTSHLVGWLHCFDLAWRAKPVGFIVYGGESKEYSAVDQLRLLLATQQAMPLGNPVSFVHAYGRFGLQGELYASLGEPQRLAMLLARLKWWAHALRQARLAMPYDQVGQRMAFPAS